MGDETTPVTPPAGDAGSTPAPGGPLTPPSEPQAGDEPISLEEARKLRSEARNLRSRLKAYDDAQAARDAEAQKAKDAQLSEIELTRKQHAELQTKYEADTDALTRRIVELEVKQIASRLGIIDPDAAVRLLDADFEIDDDGNVTNAEALLKDLLKNKPYLAGTQPSRTAPTSGGATNPPRSATSGTSAADVVALLRAQDPRADGAYKSLDAAAKSEVQRLISSRR